MDEERLIVALEARVTDFEKKMLRAERKAEKSYQGMRKASGSATKSMERDMVRTSSRINQSLASTSAKIGTFAKAMGPVGVVAGAAIGVLAVKARDAAREVADIGRAAKRAGVDVKAFQELSFVGQQNNIDVDTLTDGLKELNIRADEFVTTGKGPGAEAFGRLGFGAKELAEKLKDPSALMVELIDRMGKLDKAAQIRVGDELFGGSAGERFVELVDQGADGIRRTIKEANDLGIVLNNDVLKKAEEVDRAFNVITATIGTNIKGAIVNAASALQGFLDTFRALERQQDRTLNNTLTTVYEERASIKGELSELSKQLEADRKGLIPDIGGILTADTRSKIDELKSLDDELVSRAQRILDVKDRRNGLSDDFVYKPTPDFVPVDTSDNGKPKTKTRGGGRSGRAKSARDERDAVAELIAELHRERELIGATDQARRTSDALRQAGANATAAQRSEIIALTEAIEAETVAEEGRNDAAEKRNEYAKDFAKTTVDILKDGKVTADELTSAFSRLADTLLNEVLDSMFKVGKASNGLGGGGGGIGGFISSLIAGGGGSGAATSLFKAGMGGLFAKGGVTNQPAIFGEAGPEAAVPLPDGRSIPVTLKSPATANTQQNINITHHYVGGGEWRAESEQIANDTVRRSAPSIVKASVNAAHQNFPAMSADASRRRG